MWGYTIEEVLPGDRVRMAQVDRLLEQEGIRRDRNLDYTCAMYDGAGELAATGSCFGSTLRCLAVCAAHQGEGLMASVVSHLTQVQFHRGNSRLFLCTKCSAAGMFSGLGFSEIARVGGTLVFMENRRNGFRSYLDDLSLTRREGSAAVVMNANPFTLGHRRLVEAAARDFKTVHLFVVSEDASLVPFSVRRRLVEEGTADLPQVVLHDSGPYIISEATFPSYFLKDDAAAAEGHARLDLAVFRRIAEVLNIQCRYVGEEPLSGVTALYNRVMAAELPAAGIRCRVIPRLTTADGQVISASRVRQCLKEGRLDALDELVPACTRRFFRSPEAEPVLRRLRGTEDVAHH